MTDLVEVSEDRGQCDLMGSVVASIVQNVVYLLHKSSLCNPHADGDDHGGCDASRKKETARGKERHCGNDRGRGKMTNVAAGTSAAEQQQPTQPLQEGACVGKANESQLVGPRRVHASPFFFIRLDTTPA